jgi:hypothetical protein
MTEMTRPAASGAAPARRTLFGLDGLNFFLADVRGLGQRRAVGGGDESCQ